MKTQKIWLTLFFAVLMTLSFNVSQALACACCAERGQYRISFAAPDTAALDLLKAIKFGTDAELYYGGGEIEEVLGLGSKSDKYKFAGAFAAKQWKFNFTDDKGKAGSLVLPMPSKMLMYSADIHDTEGEVSLYKEMRFEGKASGTGFLKAGLTAPAKYFLVLQGRGNNCTNAEDFSHWRVEVTGAKADYAFFGETARAAAKAE